MPDDDDQARRKARGSFERISVQIPGFPQGRLPPPRPVRAPQTEPDELTPLEPIVARQMGKGAPVVPPPPVSMPPRSLSPAPESKPVVEVDVGKVAFRKSHLRAIWVWGAPFVLSALGFVGGAIRGYLLGLAMAHDDMVKIRTAEEMNHDHVTKIETRLDADEASAFQEAQSNRTERATAMRKLSDFAADLEAVKAAQPKIQGLTRPK